jgi:hypothetical protein
VGELSIASPHLPLDGIDSPQRREGTKKKRELEEGRHPLLIFVPSCLCGEFSLRPKRKAAGTNPAALSLMSMLGCLRGP